MEISQFEQKSKVESEPFVEATEEETEDEEVKMNCIRGKCGVQESDFSSDSEDDAGDVDIEEDQGDIGVVEFSGGKPLQSDCGPPIFRPKAVSSRQLGRLSPHQEEVEEGSCGSPQSGNYAVACDASISVGGGDGSSSEDVKSLEQQRGSIVAKADPIDTDDDETDSIYENIPWSQQPIELENLERANNQFTNDCSKIDLKLKSVVTKRVLSWNTLTVLNAEAGRSDDSPKRMRPSPGEDSSHGLDRKVPELSLGLSAMDQILAVSKSYHARQSSFLSSSDEEDLDKRLSEELERKFKDSTGDKSPVPLLTPPQSPLTIPADEGTTEWPSNLVVDSAMMSAASVTRPLSPTSLQKFEEAEEQRLALESNKVMDSEASLLAPLLQSIYVGMD